MVAKHGVLGINFDHMHMGDLLREVAEHPDAEIVGICHADPARMQAAIAKFGIPRGPRLHRSREMPVETKPDLVILCSATAEHAQLRSRASRRTASTS